MKKDIFKFTSFNSKYEIKTSMKTKAIILLIIWFFITVVAIITFKSVSIAFFLIPVTLLIGYIVYNLLSKGNDLPLKRFSSG